MADTSCQGRSRSPQDTQDQATTTVPTDNTARPFDLEFPEPPLHLSLECLLAHSSPTDSLPTSTAMLRPAEAGPLALDDSWTSLSNDDFATEEDLQSEHTDVGSLLDVHSADDVQSIAGEVNSDDGESTDDEELADTLTEELDRGNILGPYIRRPDPPPYPSIASTAPNDGETITFNGMDMYTTSRQMTPAELESSAWLGQVGVKVTNTCRVTRMPVQAIGLDLDTYSHFKVLLLGGQVEQFRTEIQRKIGDTLVSQSDGSSGDKPSSNTRFHLVPNAFGPGAKPDCADLVAIDKLVDFDCYDCVELSPNEHDPRSFVLKNTQTGSETCSFDHGHGVRPMSSRWSEPDLAIVCVHLDKNGVLDQNSRLSLSFVKEKLIPHIVIRMDRGWDGYYNDVITTRLLHETIEIGPASPLSSNCLKFPVDMAGFLNLDPVHLNKHLAHIISMGQVTSAIESELPSEKLEEKPSKFIGIPLKCNASLLKNAFIVLWIVGFYTFLGYHFWPILSDPISGASRGDVHMELTSTAPVVIATTQGISQLPQITSFALAMDLSIPSSIVEAAATKASPFVATNARHFQVSIAGNNQLLVKLPNVALSRKKRSDLVVQLRRNAQMIPAEVHELFEGVYSVQLLPREAHGDLEVNLYMNQPRLNDTVTVSFGNRYGFELQHIKQLWNTTHDHIYHMISNVSHSVGFGTRQLANSLLQSLSNRSKKLLGKGIEWNRYLPNCSAKLDLYDLVFGSAMKRRMQQLRNSIVRGKDAYFIKDNVVASALSARLRAIQANLLSLAKSMKPLQFKPKLDNVVVVEKLETARGRANRIVSKVAKSLVGQDQRV